MSRWFFVVGWLLVSCAGERVRLQAPREAEPLSRQALVRKVLPSNVRVFVLDGRELRHTASGVVVGSERSSRGSASFVVTNAHALDTTGLGEPNLRVVGEAESVGTLDLVAEPVFVGAPPEMDLALLRVRGASWPAATLASDAELETGEDVVVAAAPFGKEISLSGGLVSRVELDGSTRRPALLKTDAPIGYGASGGGVYSRRTGNLLGVVEGYRTAKVGFAVAEQDFSFEVPMPGETFAAPGAKVRTFLERAGFGRLLGGEARSNAMPRASLP